MVAKLAQSCIPVSMISPRKQSKMVMLDTRLRLLNSRIIIKNLSLPKKKKKQEGERRKEGCADLVCHTVGIFPTRSSCTKRNCTGHIRGGACRQRKPQGVPAIPELAVWKKMVTRIRVREPLLLIVQISRRTVECCPVIRLLCHGSFVALPANPGEALDE